MHKRILYFCALLLAVSLVASCGRSSEPEVPAAPEGGGGAAPAAGGAAAPATTASVMGKISFEGTPPPNDKVQMSSDPYCQQHAADYPTVETVKVTDGGLENVIVYVSS